MEIHFFRTFIYKCRFTSSFEPVPFSSEDAFGGIGTKGFNIRNPYMPDAISELHLLPRVSQRVTVMLGNYTRMVLILAELQLQACTLTAAWK